MRSTRNAAGFARVRKMGLALPGTVESVSWRSPSLKVRGRMYAVMASHRSAEPGTLVVVLPIEQRDEIIAADPETYYMTDHYLDYPSLLVRLNASATKRYAICCWRRGAWRGPRSRGG